MEPDEHRAVKTFQMLLEKQQQDFLLFSQLETWGLSSNSLNNVGSVYTSVTLSPKELNGNSRLFQYYLRFLLNNAKNTMKICLEFIHLNILNILKYIHF